MKAYRKLTLVGRWQNTSMTPIVVTFDGGFAAWESAVDNTITVRLADGKEFWAKPWDRPNGSKGASNQRRFRRWRTRA